MSSYKGEIPQNLQTEINNIVMKKFIELLLDQINLSNKNLNPTL